jgi:hypothetical protein
VFLLKQILPAVLAAVLVSGVFAIAGRLWRASNWADALALGAGYACGHLVTAGWPALPPGEATQWLPYFAIIVAIIGVLDTLLRPPGWIRAGVWFLCCAGILRLLLASKFQYGWSLLGGTAWVAVLAAGMLVLTIFFDWAAQRDASISVPLIVTIVAGGTGLALMFSGSLLLGQLAIVLAAASGAIVLVGFLLPNSVNGRGIAPVASAVLAGLWLSGYYFAELPPATALLLAAAPIPALMLVLFDESGNPRRGLLLRATLVAVPVALAVFLAFSASPSMY